MGDTPPGVPPAVGTSGAPGAPRTRGAAIGASLFGLGLMAGTAGACVAFSLAGGLSARTGDVVESLQVSTLEQRLARAEATGEEAERRRRDAAAQLAETHRRMGEIERRWREAKGALGALDDARAAGEETRRRMAAKIDAQASEIARLALALASAEAGAEGDAAVAARLGDAMQSVIVERDLALARTARLADEVGRLDEAVQLVEAREAQLLADLEAATATGLSGLERIFEDAEIDLESILSAAERDFAGKGGPDTPIEIDIEAARELGRGSVGAVAESPRVAALMAGIEKMSLLRFAADRVPFSRPVNGGRYTSGFGSRRDPFGRGRRHHNGIDIAGPHGTPITATAAGVVTFVGWQRGYGRVIEIRHAFGFETLYAHLSKARVEVGQRVEAGDRIGDMGNTGRSTGTHLHYEVRLDNRAVDPMTFIEAARDVL